MSSYQPGLVAERPASPAQPAPTPETPSFDQLGLTPELLRSVVAQGYTEPTPVQSQSIPIVLAGRDLLASAQTGTGKTAAFVLPILQLLNASRPAPRHLPPGTNRPHGATGLPIRCLVLTPTRELALQIEESVRTYGASRPIKSTTIYGGVGFEPQVRALRAGPEIVVATPGRLLDHAGQRTIDLSSVEILVLDEADRMLDMGFIRDIRRILELLPAHRQNLLFSATFSDEITGLANAMLDEPAHIQIARRNAPIELVRQVVYPVDRERKRELLSHLIRTGRIDRALVFTRTKHGASRLAEQLAHDGITASAIHGNKSQSQRVHALDDFKSGRVAILVATEVASRGLDIDGLPHVVNFELPMVAQDYVHRIGRTGRAGLEGDAVSLVCIDENLLLRDIEILLRQPIRREVVEGFEVDRSIEREPIRQRTQGFGRPNEARRAPARQAPARSEAPRQGPSYQAALRQAPRQAAPKQAGPRQAAPRQAPPAPYRRPEPSDFRQPDPRGPRQGAPAGNRHTAPGRAPAFRPGIGAAMIARPTARPTNGGYARSASNSRPPMPNARPMPAVRPGERREAFVSMPGEHITQRRNRPG
jgi:ATP-dependent RNA helicase RhlE